MALTDEDMDAYKLHKSEDEAASSCAFVLTPPSSPKASGGDSGLGKKRRKPVHRVRSMKEVMLPRCPDCGCSIDLNDLFNLHTELKQPLPEKKSRPVTQKTKENFARWRECVLEVTGAKAPVKSGQPEYEKVKELYNARAPKDAQKGIDEIKLESDGEIPAVAQAASASS